MIQGKIVDASWHRNGIAGEGFYAILFDDEKNGRMIVTLFDEPGYCAVYHVNELTLGNIKFAQGNSWRGDEYAHVIRPMLKEWLKEQGTNRCGPFSATMNLNPPAPRQP